MAIRPPPVEATQEILEAAEKLRIARQTLRSIEDEKTEYEFKIAAFMAESDTLLVGGQPYLTFRHQSRTSTDSKRLRSEDPDLFSRFSRTTQSRPILFKKVKK